MDFGEQRGFDEELASSACCPIINERPVKGSPIGSQSSFFDEINRLNLVALPEAWFRPVRASGMAQQFTTDLPIKTDNRCTG
jgi:hypothetical protein